MSGSHSSVAEGFKSSCI